MSCPFPPSGENGKCEGQRKPTRTQTDLQQQRGVINSRGSMSATTFRASPCPSYWTAFLFHFTIPSIPDSWRNWLSFQQSSSPATYTILLAIHRSVKAIYGFIIWLTRPFLASIHVSKNSSELSRALQDGLDDHILKSRAQKMYRDEDQNSDQDETRGLLSSSSHSSSNQAQSQGLRSNEQNILSNLIVSRVSWIINHSKQLQTTKLAPMNEASDPKELAEAIVAVKSINPILCPTLVECITRIQNASRTRKAIEDRSETKYNSELHQHKLKELLKLLKPSQDFDTLPPKGWQEIGFQGTDPSTDLRGAGLLGLDALVVFARYYGSSGQEIVTEAVEGGDSWYPWALASINITWWCIRLAKAKQLEYFLVCGPGDFASETEEHRRTKEQLMQDIPAELYGLLILQVKLSLLFHHFWLSIRPRPSVMDFEAQFKVFTYRAQRGLAKGFIGGLGLGWILDPAAPDFSHHQVLVHF
ncbi:hypothetical protein PCASD_20162 [Puccinia coronata f. sp. avenae]|uniref:ELMO domain-containing protein n=2 Tax=Puccinia coronata f. sp. avenae TaxID=200324 RepID=A0A2N5SCR8_9BASI|nr:hypothetical protein PCASD_20162 [Puccinia coronata f. sp. avenae]